MPLAVCNVAKISADAVLTVDTVIEMSLGGNKVTGYFPLNSRWRHAKLIGNTSDRLSVIQTVFNKNPLLHG